MKVEQNTPNDERAALLFSSIRSCCCTFRSGSWSRFTLLTVSPSHVRPGRWHRGSCQQTDLSRCGPELHSYPGPIGVSKTIEFRRSTRRAMGRMHSSPANFLHLPVYRFIARLGKKLIHDHRLRLCKGWMSGCPLRPTRSRDDFLHSCRFVWQ